MKGSMRTSVNSLKTKKGAGNWIKENIALVVFGGALIVFAYVSIQGGSKKNHGNNAYIASLPAQTDTIAHNKICMVDDIYQANYPTLMVMLSNRAYYGCSTKATQDLATQPKFRKAVDPITKSQIDKATALIAIHPKRDGTVLYFESEKTFNLYLNQQRTQ